MPEETIGLILSKINGLTDKIENVVVNQQRMQESVTEMKEEQKVMKEDITEIKEEQKVMKEDITEIKEEQKETRKDVTEMKKDIKIMKKEQEDTMIIISKQVVPVIGKIMEKQDKCLRQQGMEIEKWRA